MRALRVNGAVAATPPHGRGLATARARLTGSGRLGQHALEAVPERLRRRVIVSRSKSHPGRLVLNLSSLTAGVGLWWLVGIAGLAEPTLLPPPQEVLASLVRMVADLSLFGHIAITLARVLSGFFVAVAVALPLGVAAALSQTVRDLLEPVVELLRPIPPLAAIPLAVLWFGIGELTKVLLIALAAFFPIIVNTMAGFSAVLPIHLQAARTLGAGRWQILWFVVARAALPDVVVGLRLGLGLSFLQLVAAELIASSSGLGWLIWDARFHFMGDRILVGMIGIGFLGYALNRIALALERRVVRWQPLAEPGGVGT
jgi:ABC-type nitrate/sulfonate/bicarbonate transport system permease component